MLLLNSLLADAIYIPKVKVRVQDNGFLLFNVYNLDAVVSSGLEVEGRLVIEANDRYESRWRFEVSGSVSYTEAVDENIRNAIKTGNVSSAVLEVEGHQIFWFSFAVEPFFSTTLMGNTSMFILQTAHTEDGDLCKTGSYHVKITTESGSI